MFAPKDFELLSSTGGEPGDLGLRIVGRAKEGDGLVRVWLRRAEWWARYPDPRLPHAGWDVRVMRREHSSLATDDAFSWELLESLEESYDFPSAPSELADIKPLGDEIHDRVVAWAKDVTKVNAPSSAPLPMPPLAQASPQSIGEAEGDDDWGLEESEEG